MALPFPNISPIALSIGPLSVTWYGISYALGMILGWRYVLHVSSKFGNLLSRKIIDDFLTWIILGVFLGGRLGYVLFYTPSLFVEDPLAIFYTWKGGMSFHGGVLGVAFASFLYASRKKISFLRLSDLCVCGIPIGLFFGRIANFINGELYGRITDVPWGVVFPHGGPLGRHPSQLYEAFLEGACLFVILFCFSQQKRDFTAQGFLSGLFLLLYGIFRILVEMLREPDHHIGFFWNTLTWGQILCGPMVVFGLFLIIKALRNPSSNSKTNDS